MDYLHGHEWCDSGCGVVIGKLLFDQSQNSFRHIESQQPAAWRPCASVLECGVGCRRYRPNRGWFSDHCHHGWVNETRLEQSTRTNKVLMKSHSPLLHLAPCCSHHWLNFITLMHIIMDDWARVWHLVKFAQLSKQTFSIALDSDKGCNQLYSWEGFLFICQYH